MRKGMGLRMIGSVTLALVGVSLLIGIFSSNFGSGGGNGVFCAAYGGVGDVFPGRNAPKPEGCKSGPDIDYQSVKSSSKQEFELKLASAVTSCYDSYKGYNISDELCEGWNVKTLPDTVNESDLNQELLDNNLCGGTEISNDMGEYSSVPSCGSGNQIYFQRQNISEGDFMVMTYNYSSGTEQVIIR